MRLTNNELLKAVRLALYAGTTAIVGLTTMPVFAQDNEQGSERLETIVVTGSRIRRVDFDHRTMIVLVHRPTRLIVGLNQHQESPEARFDERRVGLDHVGFAVENRDDLDTWQAHLAALDVEHSPVEDTDAGSALVFRDPDNIQLEMWWTKPRAK